jgi:hypothetical protein
MGIESTLLAWNAYYYIGRVLSSFPKTMIIIGFWGFLFIHVLPTFSNQIEYFVPKPFPTSRESKCGTFTPRSPQTQATESCLIDTNSGSAHARLMLGST